MLLLLSLLTVQTATFARDAFLAQDIHLIKRLPTSFIPLTSAHVQQRLEEAAKTYATYAPVPRIALYDIAFPKDDAEFKALNGHAVLLVTTITQDPEELPLKRVYVRQGDKDIVLEEIVAWGNELPPDDKIGRVFGLHRTDAFYLFHVHLYIIKGKLLLDFAKNRENFQLGEFPLSLPLDYNFASKQNRSDETKPILPAILTEFLRREFLFVLDIQRDAETEPPSVER